MNLYHNTRFYIGRDRKSGASSSSSTSEKVPQIAPTVDAPVPSTGSYHRFLHIPHTQSPVYSRQTTDLHYISGSRLSSGGNYASMERPVPYSITARSISVIRYASSSLRTRLPLSSHRSTSSPLLSMTRTRACGARKTPPLGKIE